MIQFCLGYSVRSSCGSDKHMVHWTKSRWNLYEMTILILLDFPLPNPPTGQDINYVQHHNFIDLIHEMKNVTKPHMLAPLTNSKLDHFKGKKKTWQKGYKERVRK